MKESPITQIPVDDIQTDLVLHDGIMTKVILLKQAGTIVPQHSHKYDHSTVLASGSVRGWKDGVQIGDFVAPVPIFIEAGKQHTFMCLEKDTVILCIHRIDRTGEIEFSENDHDVTLNDLVKLVE
jgi:hypothetical protein